MANAAFYYLEPQARDGFVGWRVLDQWLHGPGEYPIFEYRREVGRACVRLGYHRHP